MQYASLLAEFWLTPVTAATCGVLIAIWFHLWNSRVPVDKVAFSYNRVVNHHEYWRVLSGAHSHFDPIHLFFNVQALWSCRFVEYELGSWAFLIQSLALAVACKLLMVLALGLASKQFPQQTRGWLDQWTVGYSAVIFAWMTVLSSQANTVSSVFGLVEVPSYMAPFVSLLITQVIVRNASFLGHASGIVAGGLLLTGAFNWLADPYWSACFLFWVFGTAIVSLRATTPVPVPCIPYVNCWGDQGRREAAGRAPPGAGDLARVQGYSLVDTGSNRGNGPASASASASSSSTSRSPQISAPAAAAPTGPTLV